MVGGSFIDASRKLSEFPSVVCIPLGVLVPLVLCFTVHMDILRRSFLDGTSPASDIENTGPLLHIFLAIFFFFKLLVFILAC